ncbi:MAG: hypothetical protein K6E47_13980, partial [Lachnospiraceae bacterium]|nr:hypothetical protein [Lachnospiraceae bacterium]
MKKVTLKRMFDTFAFSLVATLMATIAFVCLSGSNIAYAANPGDVVIDQDTILSSDLSVSGDLYVDSVTFNCNRHTVTVGGNVYLYGDNGKISCIGGELIVGKNLYVRAGTVYLNGGELRVNGDAIFAWIDEDEHYQEVKAVLKMDNEDDVFTIGGNLVTYLYGSSYKGKQCGMLCNAGCIKLAKNWENYGACGNTEDLEVVLTGGGAQKLLDNNFSWIIIPNLTVNNSTDRSITISGYIDIGTLNSSVSIIAKAKSKKSPCLYIEKTKGSLDIDGDIELHIGKAGGNISVNGNLLGWGIRLSGKKLEVKGDYQNGSNKYDDGLHSELYLDGGTMIVDGNAIFASIDADEHYQAIDGILKMDNESDALSIGGDLITCFSEYYYSHTKYNMYCSAGKIKLAGNWIDYNRCENNSGTFELEL